MHSSARYKLCNIKQNNSDINKKDDNGCTPFLLACKYGYIDIVTSLLKNLNHTRLNKKDNFGNTPFLVACQHDNIEIVKILLMQKDLIRWMIKFIINIQLYYLLVNLVILMW